MRLDEDDWNRAAGHWRAVDHEGEVLEVFALVLKFD